MARSSIKRDKIWAALRAGEALTSQQIATMTGIALGHVCNELGAFHRAALVDRVGVQFRRTRGRPWGVWQIAPGWRGRARPIALKALIRAARTRQQAPPRVRVDREREAADAIERQIEANLRAIRARRAS